MKKFCTCALAAWKVNGSQAMPNFGQYHSKLMSGKHYKFYFQNPYINYYSY